MTAYSGQLACVDLDTLGASLGPSSSWALRILAESRAVLRRRDAPILDAWAQALDAVLEQRSAARGESPLRRGVAGGHDLDYIHLRARPIAADVNAGLLAASDAPTEAELYAVFALWKLVDRMQLQAAPRKKPSFAWLPANALRRQQPPIARLVQQQEAEALLSAAVHASATAWQMAMAMLQSAQSALVVADAAQKASQQVEGDVISSIKQAQSLVAQHMNDQKHARNRQASSRLQEMWDELKAQGKSKNEAAAVIAQALNLAPSTVRTKLKKL